MAINKFDDGTHTSTVLLDYSTIIGMVFTNDVCPEIHI